MNRSPYEKSAVAAPNDAGIALLWSRGEYARIAELLRPAADEVARALGDGHARRALDLATGTGSLALALAERGWAVSATDLCEPLLNRARSSADDHGQIVSWRTAPLEDLPFEDMSFDVVASSFGLIFATDPDTALQEAHRCLVPGGRLVLTAWPRSGHVADLAAVIGGYLPSGPADADPLCWGDPQIATARLREGFTDVVVQEHALAWAFDSVEVALDVLFSCSPLHVAALEAAGPHAEAMRSAVRGHLAAGQGPDGRLEIVVPYRVVVARRA